MVSQNFKKGVIDFIKNNQKNIKVSIKEFMYYVYVYQDEYPKDLEKKMKYLKRDWSKNGYVKGFAVAYNVYNKLKTSKKATDLIYNISDFYKAFDYFKNNLIESVTTIETRIYNLFDLLENAVKNINIDTTKLNFLEIGKLGTIISLFLTPTKLSSPTIIKEKTLEELSKTFPKFKEKEIIKQQIKTDKKNKDIRKTGKTYNADLKELSNISKIAPIFLLSFLAYQLFTKNKKRKK